MGEAATEPATDPMFDIPVQCYSCWFSFYKHGVGKFQKYTYTQAKIVNTETSDSTTEGGSLDTKCRSFDAADLLQCRLGFGLVMLKFKLSVESCQGWCDPSIIIDSENSYETFVEFVIHAGRQNKQWIQQSSYLFRHELSQGHCSSLGIRLSLPRVMHLI